MHTCMYVCMYVCMCLCTWCFLWKNLGKEEKENKDENNIDFRKCVLICSDLKYFYWKLFYIFIFIVKKY